SARRALGPEPDIESLASVIHNFDQAGEWMGEYVWVVEDLFRATRTGAIQGHQGQWHPSALEAAWEVGASALMPFRRATVHGIVRRGGWSEGEPMPDGNAMELSAYPQEELAAALQSSIDQLTSGRDDGAEFEALAGRLYAEVLVEAARAQVQPRTPEASAQVKERQQKRKRKSAEAEAIGVLSMNPT